MKAALGICTKNNENTIQKQLRILLSQKTKPDEFVFVDSSQDRTPRLIRDTLDPAGVKYKIIRQKGEGIGDARQEIFEYVRNKFDVIVFLDTERYPISKDWFKNHLKFHINHRDYAVLNGRLVKKDYEPKSPFEDANYFIQCNCSIKIEYLERAGGYDRSFKRGEDWDLAIRLFKIGAKSFVSRDVAIYVDNPDTLSVFLRKKFNRSISIKFLRKYGIWYLKKYPQHLIVDCLGTANLLSLVTLPISSWSILLYGITLLVFNIGIYKSNKNIILGFKWTTILLPIVYGLSVFKNFIYI